MIKSMTGFGKDELEINSKKITIEIKSLNSKQADVSTRLPQLCREKDLEIRRMISDKLFRGKIDVLIYSENLGDSGNTAINENIVKSYFADLSKISQELQIPVNERLLQIIMRLPDSVKTSFDALEEEEWARLSGKIAETLDKVDAFRNQEGRALEVDLRGNIETIQRLLSEIGPYEQPRLEAIRNRMKENLESLKLNGSVDQNRFEQEMIFYLERLDFNEEKVRLGNHLRYFVETLEEPESNGRKLAFIAQEIGREINTIGSKANESHIQKLVVMMKDALERIKEQVLNVL
ncbi:MAG TPA: YicC family protein [Prolixibacteraceae bacterium]|nr:YicC family protein [Prolixibacteraceae bacterium]